MASLSSCPGCNTSLGLFTPREISRHINECLDAQRQQSQSPQPLPSCPVCHRDLTELTVAARAEHENRCVDNLNPPSEKDTSRRKSTRVSRRPRSPPKKASGDKRVRRFLELLGLERFAQKFADEEVDFPALRLLEDSDLANLRIPDAARRRIADALTAVPILAQIEGAHVNEPAPEPAVLPTQRFGTSWLAHQMQRNKPMVQLDDSDGEYAPTPIVEPCPHDGKSTSDSSSREQDADKSREVANNEDEGGGVSKGESDDFEEIERAVKSGYVAPASESSDLSSLASDPEELSELLRSTSQITVELKLQKWRRKQIEKEKSRHELELHRIESEYMKLVKSTNTVEDRQEGKVSAPPELPKHLERNCDTIDLTQDMSDEENGCAAPTERALEKSVVISSNESDLKMSSIRRRDSQEAEMKGESCKTVLQKEPEQTACVALQSREPESSFSETCTPEQNKKKTSTDEEVIDLISTDKKRGSNQPLHVALSRNGDNIAPLFSQTSNGDEVGGTQRNLSDSDEDFMDLLGVGKENTRSSSQPTRSTEDVPKRSSIECDSSTEDVPSQSRLKKRQKQGKRAKATSQDIAQLIRMNKVLYEDILLMESVSFDRILCQLPRGQKRVTKKALYNFLQDEGILFSGDPVEAGSQQESYLRFLNSDRCPD